MIHKTDMEEIMYQKIIELLRIHGYLSQDTEKGPCYVKSTKKRNKCVYVMFDKNPDGSAILEEDLYQMEDCAKQNFGADCAILLLVLSEEDDPMFIDPDDQFKDLFRPLTMILSQNQAEQREDVTNDFENINEIKRFVWNYKGTLVIFLLNLAGFVL